jgi:hypothetical protein
VKDAVKVNTEDVSPLGVFDLPGFEVMVHACIVD